MSRFVRELVCALIGHQPRRDFYTRQDPQHEVLVERVSCDRCDVLVSKTDRLRLERLDGF